MLDVRGFTFVVGFLQMFCSGMILPLVAFPDTLEPVVRLLPFAALVQVPAEVFLEKATGAGAGCWRWARPAGAGRPCCSAPAGC